MDVVQQEAGPDRLGQHADVLDDGADRLGVGRPLGLQDLELVEVLGALVVLDAGERGHHGQEFHLEVEARPLLEGEAHLGQDDDQDVAGDDQDRHHGDGHARRARVVLHDAVDEHLEVPGRQDLGELHQRQDREDDRRPQRVGGEGRADDPAQGPKPGHRASVACVGGGR